MASEGGSEEQARDTRTVRAADGSASERFIGPYRILRELGHGGMGSVYLAVRADEQFHKRVALKVIRSGADSADVVRQFRRERQILAGLDHPNIARLLDGGTTDDGLPYLVMEYVEGKPLLEYCDARSLTVNQRVVLFQAVCAAVQHAHRNLIVHRDIKPGNVLVGEDGAPRLLDFGIAKILNPELTSESAPPTAIVMTPEYASPEQARGDQVTTATDVYSLGVVLYELLTGHRPYRLTSRQPLDVLRAVAEQEPEPASVAVGRTDDVTAPSSGRRVPSTPAEVASTREGTTEKLRRRLRGDLDKILMKALRKEPALRYPSVEALSEDIRRYLTGLPVAARKATIRYRAGKLARRHTLAVVSSAVIVLLLAGLAATMTIQSARIAAERDRAERERDAAEKERRTAERVSAFLADLFKLSDPSQARGREITAREILERGAGRIRRELAEEPEAQARLLLVIGSVYEELGRYDEAEELLKDALAARERAATSDELEIAKAMSGLANVLRRKGDYAGAVTLHEKILEIRRRRLGGDHADVASTLNNLAAVRYSMGEHAEAARLYEESLRIRRIALGNEDIKIAQSLGNLGLALGAMGDPRAEAYLTEALTLVRKLEGDDHPGVTRTLYNLAATLANNGKHEEAEARLREALAIQVRLLGRGHPDVAMTMNGIGRTLVEKGRLAEAGDAYREALGIARAKLPATHVTTAGSLEGLGRLETLQGRPAAGEPLLREALGMLRKLFPEGGGDVAELQGELGENLLMQRRFAEAEPLLLAAYGFARSRPGPAARASVDRLVRLYDRWRRDDEARRYRAELAAPASPPR
jgi:serine/threonine-protein kinase